jgi:hypothetical protein
MTEPHKRAYRHPKYKTVYRVKNWPEYDTSLRDRGDIALWISHEAIDAWTPPQTGKEGAQPVYSDMAIETALALRLLFQGYYDQAYAENAFARYKRTFGGSLRAKRDDAQEREALLGCVLLNRLRKLGRPQSYPVS